MRLTFSEDLFEATVEQVRHVPHIARSAYRDHGGNVRQPLGRGRSRRAPKLWLIRILGG